jgi:3-oxosteroid 1-dehydrogenase
MYPGDVSTCEGGVADEHARVLREDGSSIHGLYAAGCTAASVTGRVYPAAGCSIGSSATFAYIAVQHMVESQRRP